MPALCAPSDVVTADPRLAVACPRGAAAVLADRVATAEKAKITVVDAFIRWAGVCSKDWATRCP